MRPGKVEIGTPNELSLVHIRQGADYLYGKLRNSQNREFSVVAENTISYRLGTASFDALILSFV
ncbi:MAG: hypothetical protein ACREBU_02220 [Nitrososphaera sp.]